MAGTVTTTGTGGGPATGVPGARRRRLLLVVLSVLAGLLVYLGVTWVQVLRTADDHDAGPVDAILVMGAAQYDGRPSPQLAARLDHVVTLWGRGVAPLVVVTGGKRPGDRFSEAQASAGYLVDAGVPADAIVEVSEGSTTYESIAATVPVVVPLGVRSVALVTDPYHGLRSRLIAEAAGFEVDVATTPGTVVAGWTERRRELGEAAGVALGRIIGFDRLSDLTG